MEQKMTLFELTQWIKSKLTDALPGTVWVIAEISEMKENRNGHCYLELVERKDNNTIARARAIIWSYTYRMLKPYFETTTGRLFTQGLKIMVQVTVEFHPVYGLSLNIKDIEPAFTIGDMALQRIEIIERLKAERIFNMNKELVLPIVPQRIAVISSKTAAGYQDFINHLENNERGIKFYSCLFEAYMQGDEAVPSIINALERIFKNEGLFDAVAIIRGGGAVADLSCFDNYELALNITQFPLPVITGIGHEKDDTIIDMVSHTRLKTPTAVAEFFISGAERFYERLLTLQEEVIQIAGQTVESKNMQLKTLAGDQQKLVYNFIGKKSEYMLKRANKLQREVVRFSINRKYELDNLKHDLRVAISIWSVKLDNGINRHVKTFKNIVNQLLLRELTGFKRMTEKIISLVNWFMAKEIEKINLNEKAMRLLDPVNILKRGYTLTLYKGVIVKSAALLHLNDEIETRFSDGNVKSKITKK